MIKLSRSNTVEVPKHLPYCLPSQFKERLSKERTATVAAPTTATSTLGPSATHDPNTTSENGNHRNMVPVVPLQMRSASALTNQTSGPIIYPSQTQ